MKKMIFVLLAVFLVCQCAFAENEAPEEAAKDLYSGIEMNVLMENLSDLYEIRETEDGYFLVNGEVLLAFYESGRLQAKARTFENVSDIAPIAQIPLSELSGYKQGMPVQEVISAFGAEGLEIMRINLADEDDAGLRRVLVWKTQENKVVQALFELDDNEWVLFAIAEVNQ